MITLQECKSYGYKVASDILKANAPYRDEEMMNDVLSSTLEHYQQFSPFEFYANEMNKKGEKAWDAYNSGIGKAAEEYAKNTGFVEEN